MLEEHGEVGKFEYNQIDDYVYIGTNMCCQTHFDERLLKIGVNADLSLEEERLDAPFGVKYFLWLPTKDTTPPTQKQFKTGVNFLESLISLKEKVYVHCMNGHGRAPTLVAAYYIKQGKTVEEAINFIVSKRDVVHINKEQKEALEEYARRL